MRQMAAEGVRVDALVSDTPYHLKSIVARFGKTSLDDDTQTSQRARDRSDPSARLTRGFMGQSWDGGDVSQRVEVWRAAYRLLKPGGWLLAMSATRTQHRMVCAIEDAGFEIRDLLGWMYGQGFAKNKTMRNGEAVGLKPAWEPICVARKPLGEATVLASQGQVTPAAEAIFRKAVSLDAGDPRARYYLAVGKDQKGDAKGAMDDWIALLKSAPPDAPWAPEVRAFVEKVAQDRHVDLTGRLPPAPAGPALAEAAPSGSPPGPNADQVAAAGQMSAEGRQAMIEGMVAKQAASLKANPRDLDGWQRLIRARMVLGQAQAAAQAYRDASKVFAGSPTEQAALRQTAASVGVPGI